MDPNDILSGLDFEPTLTCEETGQQYTYGKLVLTPAGFREVPDPYPKVPFVGQCQNKAVRLFTERVCPCYLTLEKIAPEDRHRAHTLGGLILIRHALCQDHIDYWTEYVRWPLRCGSCQTTFMHFGEKFVDSTDLTNG